MDESENDVSQQLRETFQTLEAAQKKTQEQFEHALQINDLNLARQLVAIETAAELRVETVMHKFADQADTWANRVECEISTKDRKPEIKAGFDQIQKYAEAELECKQKLQQSETKILRLKLLKLEAPAIPKLDLQRLVKDWSRRAEAAKKAHDYEHERFALECRTIYQKALDEKH